MTQERLDEACERYLRATRCMDDLTVLWGTNHYTESFQQVFSVLEWQIEISQDAIGAVIWG